VKRKKLDLSLVIGHWGIGGLVSGRVVSGHWGKIEEEVVNLIVSLDSFEKKRKF
jgi:hypothetical protein